MHKAQKIGKLGNETKGKKSTKSLILKMGGKGQNLYLKISQNNEN